MKISATAAPGFFRQPDPRLLGALLYGPDEGLLTLRRQDLVARIAEGDEMRITRLDAADLRRDPALLDDALRARGFFPGRRVVVVDRATDGLAAMVKPLLDVLTPEHAFLILVGPGIAGRSSLRKLFETADNLAAVGLYAKAPEAGELADGLAAAGLRNGLTPDGMAALTAAAADLDPGSVARLVETIALFGAGRDEPLTLDEVAALLPASVDTALDAVVGAVADGRVRDVGLLMRRLMASGGTPTGLMIAVGRHLKLLMALAHAPDGPERAVGRLRPPLFGPRRDAALRQVRRWGAPRIETGLRQVMAADRALRSPGHRPDTAMVERTLIRLAMLPG